MVVGTDWLPRKLLLPNLFVYIIWDVHLPLPSAKLYASISRGLATQKLLLCKRFDQASMAKLLKSWPFSVNLPTRTTFSANLSLASRASLRVYLGMWQHSWVVVCLASSSLYMEMVSLLFGCGVCMIVAACILKIKKKKTCSFCCCLRRLFSWKVLSPLLDVVLVS